MYELGEQGLEDYKKIKHWESLSIKISIPLDWESKLYKTVFV